MALSLIAQLLPKPWWYQAGLRSDPGVYAGMNSVEYPFCQAWNDYQGGDRRQRDLHGPGTHVVEVSTPGAVKLNWEQNMLVVLPPKARIVAVYCGMATRGTPVRECSRGGCEGMAPYVADSSYTKGHVLTLTMMNRQVADRDRPTGRFWVAWQDEDAPAGASEAGAPPAAPPDVIAAPQRKDGPNPS
jgi:hypothetical protein